MKIGNNEVIDPTFKGNMARFINHSCQPNCITEKWNVLGEICVGIFASRDIEEDEELTFDYQFDSFRTPLTKCLCGTPKCKGYLGVIPQQYTLEDWEEKLENLPCSICGQNTEDDDGKLLICDRCNEGFHIFCLVPLLTEIPKEAWYCDKCQVILQTEREENKPAVNAAEMNKRLYEYIKKKRGIKDTFPKRRRPIYSDDEEEIDVKGIKKKSKFSEEYEESFKLQKKLEREAKKEICIEEPQDEFGKIKKKLKNLDERIKPLIDQPLSNVYRAKSIEEENKFKYDNDLKQMAIILFDQRCTQVNEKIKDFEKILQEDEKLHVGSMIDKINRHINTIELAIIKKNIQVFIKIGAKLSWIASNTLFNYDSFKRHIEITLLGTAKQIECSSKYLDEIAAFSNDFEKLKGRTEAIMKMPAIYLKRIIGIQHHNL